MKFLIIVCCLSSSFPCFSQKKIAVPQKQIIVSKDSTGDYKTVQAAINSIPSPNTKPVTIIIKPGIYKERVVVDSGKNFITLKGEPKSKTLITFAYHSGSKPFKGDTLNILSCATFLIYANDFNAENIHFDNSAGLYAGPAVAVRAEGNRIAFSRCLITGFQNVLFLSGSGAKHYFENCFVQGTRDIIFGSATAYFKSCRISSLKNSNITSASTSNKSEFGFIFYECNLTMNDDLGNVSLGRPASPNATVTYIKCEMDKHIIPEGWSSLKNSNYETTVRFAEYKSTGPGAKPAARVKWSKQLTDEQVKKYSVPNILGNWVSK